MADVRKRRWGWPATIAMWSLALLVLYQLAFYWTHRSVVDSYGLGPVEFPDDVAQPFFTPARLLDEHVLGLEARIDKFMNDLLD